MLLPAQGCRITDRRCDGRANSLLARARGDGELDLDEYLELSQPVCHEQDALGAAISPASALVKLRTLARRDVGFLIDFSVTRDDVTSLREVIAFFEREFGGDPEPAAIGFGDPGGG
jgi:hypothetical protein